MARSKTRPRRGKNRICLTVMMEQRSRPLAPAQLLGPREEPRCEQGSKLHSSVAGAFNVLRQRIRKN